MAVLYELLAGRGAAPRRATATDCGREAAQSLSTPAGVNPVRTGAATGAEPLVHCAQPPADLLVRGARVLDPRPGSTRRSTSWCGAGRVAELAAPGSAPAPEGAEVLDGEGHLLVPASSTPTCTSRVPGQEHKEDLDSGTRAAAAGGYVAVVAMPNTDPWRDDATVLRSLREAARHEARIPVGFLASVTTRATH